MDNAYAAIVIGGGMSGLCAAFYLQRALGEDAVLVLEAADRPGGTARTESIDGFTCEWGPNGFLDREPKTLAWVADLGLQECLLRSNAAAAKRFILHRGELHELKGPPAFLASPLLSIAGRMRLLGEPLIPAKRDDSLETIWEFAARRIGKEAADVLVSSMVSGVFGGDAKQLSLEHCFPRMAAMERTYGSLFKALMAKRKEKSGASPMGPAGTLTSFKGGVGQLVEGAAAALGVNLRRTSSVESVRREEGGYIVETHSGERYRSRAVVVAAPSFAAAGFLAGFGAELCGALASIPYAPIAVLCAGFDRASIGHDLDGFGFLIPRIDEILPLGCLWCSSIFDHRAPAGKVLFRVMFGGATNPEALQLSDEEMLGVFVRDLGPQLGIQGAPVMTRVFRHDRGIPQYDLGHSNRLAVIDAAEQENPGLFFAANAYRGVSLNDCVLSAHRAVEGVVGFVNGSGRSSGV